MKTVVRNAVFETNSSSTHTLTLISKADYETDKAQAKPKYRRYNVISSKYDKLLLAAGCCYEMFVRQDYIEECAKYGDEDDVQRKKDYDELKYMLDVGAGDQVVFTTDDFTYEMAMDMLVRVYCQLTGESYDAIYQKLDAQNRSGRACHMTFFYEGALDDAEWDYMTIYDLFIYSDENEALDNVRRYFDDDNVICYREFYQGIRRDDDDD